MNTNLEELCVKINEAKRHFNSSKAKIDGFEFKTLDFLSMPFNGFAVFSEEEYDPKLEKLDDYQKKYRYYYYEDFRGPEEKGVIIIMFNPSSASPYKRDKTIKNCNWLLRKSGYKDMEIINLFADRNPSASKIKRKSNELNKKFLEVFLKNRPDSDIVFAWGYGKEDKYEAEINYVKNLVKNNPQYIISVNQKGIDKICSGSHHPAPSAWTNFGNFYLAAELKKL